MEPIIHWMDLSEYIIYPSLCFHYMLPVSKILLSIYHFRESKLAIYFCIDIVKISLFCNMLYFCNIFSLVLFYNPCRIYIFQFLSSCCICISCPIYILLLISPSVIVIISNSFKQFQLFCQHFSHFFFPFFQGYVISSLVSGWWWGRTAICTLPIWKFRTAGMTTRAMSSTWQHARFWQKSPPLWQWPPVSFVKDYLNSSDSD